MTDSVSFHVDGVPIPQGSATAFPVGGRCVVTATNNKALKPWRALVAAAADVGVGFDVPVVVSMTFYMPMPKRPKFQVPAVRPDLDKLERAVNDGMTDAGLIADDSLIVRSITEKVYSESPGVSVTVREWGS